MKETTDLIREPAGRRLIFAAGYLAAVTVILLSVLIYALSKKREISDAEEVSPSYAAVSDTDVSSGDYADGNSTTSASPSDTEYVTSTKQTQKHKNAEFVRVSDYIPDIEVELVYAMDENFTGKVIYDFSDAWLRYGTVKKLASAQEKLKEQGFRLKIWDAFRPVSAQFRLWKICPDPRYVANPNKGFSSHSRGNTVDVTLVDMEGNEAAMPTGFDDFSRLADRNYSDVRDKAAVANVRLLENTMKDCGFVPYSGEWWHFSDSTSYGVAKDFDPE